MWVYLTSRDMQTELKCHQYSKLRCDQLLFTQTKHALGFLNQTLQHLALDVVQFGTEEQTSAGTKLPVVLVDHVGQDQLLEVDVRLRDGQEIDARVHLVDTLHLTFNTSELAERQLNVGELFPKFVVQLLFEIRRTHVIDHGSHVRGEGQQGTMFAGDQLRVVQNVRRVLHLKNFNRLLFKLLYIKLYDHP